MFIKLTKTDGTAVWLNPDFIVRIEAWKKGSAVAAAGDGDFEVMETPRAIFEMVGGAAGGTPATTVRRAGRPPPQWKRSRISAKRARDGRRRQSSLPRSLKHQRPKLRLSPRLRLCPNPRQRLNRYPNPRRHRQATSFPNRPTRWPWRRPATAISR